MIERLKKIAVDDEKRIKAQFVSVFGILGVVSLFLAAYNAFSGEPLPLILAALVFGLLSLLNGFLAGFGRSEACVRLAKILFVIEAFALATYLLVSGIPEGLSAVWLLLLPAFGFLLFRRKWGTVLNLAILAELVFLFWTPFGRGLLQYRYAETFLTRFPIIFAVFFLVGLFLEVILEITFENFRHYYCYDELTDVLNRRGFADHIERVMKESASDKAGFYIFDLDYFKGVNDRFGHPAGDEVLKQTAENLQSIVGLPLCRFGGEEFAAFDPEGKIKKADLESFCRAFTEKEIYVKGEKVLLTVSAGGAVMKREGEDLYDRLLREADAALYRAKESGRNRADLTDLTE